MGEMMADPSPGHKGQLPRPASNKSQRPRREKVIEATDCDEDGSWSGKAAVEERREVVVGVGNVSGGGGGGDSREITI